MDYNDVMCCIERDWGTRSDGIDVRGWDRKDFTLEQSEELAWAWEISFRHSARLARLSNQRIAALNLRHRQEFLAERESLFIENPELYATEEFDLAHPCNPGAANPQNPHCTCGGASGPDEQCNYDGCPKGGDCEDHADRNDGCQICVYGFCPDCCGSCKHGPVACEECKAASKGPKNDYEDGYDG